MSGQARSEPSVAPGRAELSCFRPRRPAVDDCQDEAVDGVYGGQGRGFKAAFADARPREYVPLILRVRDAGWVISVVAETPVHRRLREPRPVRKGSLTLDPYRSPKLRQDRHADATLCGAC